MSKIEWLLDNIEEELEDAEKYIVKAMACRERDTDLANSCFQLSEQEVGHATVLHGHLVRAMQTEEMSDGMLMYLEREQSKYMRFMMRVRVQQEMFHR